MVDLPVFLKQGEKARLIPVLADSSREKRITSILLSIMTQVPELVANLFRSIGVRTGKRTSIEAFVEIIFQNQDDNNDRPDGLITIKSNKLEWSAIIESKIGGNSINEQQIIKYAEIAKSNNIQAVITISNQFVARPDHSPVQLPRNLSKKVALYHWTWTSILTEAKLIEHKKYISDPEQLFLLNEFIRFLDHPNTGVDRFTSMNKGWRDLVRAVGTGEALRKSSEDVEGAITSWFQEQRDLSLLMSRHVGEHVSFRLEPRFRDDPLGRFKEAAAQFVQKPELTVELMVPAAASALTVSADLIRKCIQISMSVRAPIDRKSTKARVNWLIKMLKVDDPRIIVRANWPSKVLPTQRGLKDLRDDPVSIQATNPALVPHSFEILFIEDIGPKFSGPRSFIDEIERLVPDFYDVVGQNLRAWQAPPPKPLQTTQEDELGTEAKIEETSAEGDAVRAALPVTENSVDPASKDCPDQGGT